MDANSVRIFDNVIEYYKWPPHTDNAILDQMTDYKNFTPGNYKSAVSCYKNWCEKIYPGLDISQRDPITKLFLASSIYTINRETAERLNRAWLASHRGGRRIPLQ